MSTPPVPEKPIEKPIPQYAIVRLLQWAGIQPELSILDVLAAS